MFPGSLLQRPHVKGCGSGVLLAVGRITLFESGSRAGKKKKLALQTVVVWSLFYITTGYCPCGSSLGGKCKSSVMVISKCNKPSGRRKLETRSIKTSLLWGTTRTLALEHICFHFVDGDSESSWSSKSWMKATGPVTWSEFSCFCSTLGQVSVKNLKYFFDVTFVKFSY